MKYIFLDIDGVLNNEKTKESCPSGSTGIEDSLVKRLASIVQQTNAKIVLTSDWKREWESVEFCCSDDAKYLNEKLKQYGLSIYAKTYDEQIKDYFFNDRGKGIYRFLDYVKDEEGYVIIDDHIFGDFDDNLLNHLVLTAYKTGLTEENVKKVLNILNNADISSTGNV